MHSRLDVSRLVKLQLEIAKRVKIQPLSLDRVEAVVALDAAYSRKYGAVGVAVAYSVRENRVLETSIAVGEPPMEYVPGFLAFREAPVLYTALQGIHVRYDLLIIDGHGIAHPRGAGIATHIGVAVSKPSIGVAKKRLVGVEKTLEGRQVLVHNGRVVAIVVKTPRGRRLYVSPGNLVDLDTAAEIVRKLLRSHSLPEPLHIADTVSKDVARKLDRGSLTPKDLTLGRRLW